MPRNTTSRSRRMICARFASKLLALLKTRAQGRPGARRTRGLVCKLHKEIRKRAYRFGGGIPAFPAQWFTAYFELSPVIGLFCHRRLADTSAKLDASVEASGPHDFAVRVSAVRQGHFHVHRIPRPTSVTTAKRPSCGHETAEIWTDLRFLKIGIFFQKGLDKGVEKSPR